MFSTNDLSQDCLADTAAQLKGALNKHIEVYNIWNDCIQDLACDFDEGEPNAQAQTKWVEAGKLSRRSQRGLDDLSPARYGN